MSKETAGKSRVTGAGVVSTGAGAGAAAGAAAAPAAAARAPVRQGPRREPYSAAG